MSKPAETDVVTFHASRRQAMLMTALSAGFVVGCYFMRVDHPFIAWVGILFFGLGMLAGFRTMLSPKATFLRLDREGFEMSGIGHTSRTRWTDVERFELGTFNHVKMIAVVFAPHYRAQTLVRSVGRQLAGMEGAIANIYTVPLEALVVTLNEWRARYGTRDALALERLAPR